MYLYSKMTKNFCRILHGVTDRYDRHRGREIRLKYPNPQVFRISYREDPI